jgi:pimeloyl-ACP methyl ester carboxylesterase
VNIVSQTRSFFAEARRRKVWRVAGAYIVVGAVLVGAANDVLPRLALPEWTVTFVVVVTLLGFPIALALGWALEPATEIPERLPPSGRYEVERTAAGSGGTARAADDDPVPSIQAEARQQEIRYCTTSDDVRIAYSMVGSGPFIVRVLGHFTHLEMEWEWPELRRFWEHLAEQYTVVRYDGRGIGLSEPYVGEFTEETRLLDLDAVLRAVGAETVALLGISEGGWTAAMYTIEHPERVTNLILYGAYRRGARARPAYDPEEDEALVTLIRKGWGRDTPAFRQVFTSQFFRPDAEPGLISHFNDLQRMSADPDTAARYYESCHRRGEGQGIYEKIRVPTLVLHSREDLAVSAEEGRLLAATVPGAQLVLLPGGSHYLPTDGEVASRAAGAIYRFLNESAGSRTS